MLAFLLLSRENRWSSKSHHACMFGRVATEVNTVKIRPMGQMIWRFISKAQTRSNGSRNDFRYEAVINACGLRSIADFQLLTLERRKSVIQEVMRSLDVRPRQLSRVTGMNYETIRNIAKKLP
jgi:hypothetical protein